MSIVTISPRFQVVIPKEIREKMRIKAGQRFEVLQYEGRIALIPIESIENLRGFLKGMSSDVQRDEEDRV